MDTKKLMVSILAIVSVLFLVATVSATPDIADIEVIKVDGVEYLNGNTSVEAGQTVEFEVTFEALGNARDVRMKVEIEGEKVDSETVIGPFDIEQGYFYTKRVSVEVPYELKDAISEDIVFGIKIWNGDYRTENDDLPLRVQRPSYNADIMSIATANTVKAGQTMPVDIVLKNIGYNDLDDIYVTATLVGVNGMSRNVYFGDLVAVESDDDDEETDTVSGRIMLEVPYDVVAGSYTLEVEARNDDLKVEASRQVVIENAFENVVIPTSEGLLIVNPTNEIVVYRVVPQAAGDLSVKLSESTVVVPSGASKVVEVTAEGKTEGTYSYDVSILAMDGSVVQTVTLTSNVEGEAIANPVMVLTVILAIVFVVLLVVLIVLIGKKPEKAEEFGESYY
jgi:hypothetical protein